MKYNPEIHHRRSIRLKEYDYSQVGAYFITICTHNHELFFGEIINEEMILNEYGIVAYNEWIKLPDRFIHIEMDAFQIMPNHIHGIIIINHANVGAPLAGAQLKKDTQNIADDQDNTINQNTSKKILIGNIVGAFKSLVSNECMRIAISKNEPMGKLWQRNYYEHIARNDTELNQFREYIFNNPSKT